MTSRFFMTMTTARVAASATPSVASARREAAARVAEAIPHREALAVAAVAAVATTTTTTRRAAVAVEADGDDVFRIA